MEAPQKDSHAPSQRRRYTLAVLGLTLLCGAMRLRGLDFLLPHHVDPDAHLVVQLRLIEAGDPDPAANLNWGKYPHLVPRLAALLPRGFPHRSEPQDALAIAAEPFLRVRAVVLCLSLLLIPGVYRLSRYWCDRKCALLAAALAATSLLGFSFAQQARPHAAAASCMLWAVLLSVSLLRKPSPARAALAGLGTGLAAGSLQFGWVTLPGLLLALVLAKADAKSRFLACVTALLIFSATVPLLQPYLFDALAEREQTSAESAMELDGGVLRLSGHVIYLGALRGEGLAVIWRALLSYEPLLLICMGCLPLLLFKRARRPAWLQHPGWRQGIILLSAALPFFVVVALYKRSYERFCLPLIPYACLLAAMGARAAWNTLGIHSRALGYLGAAALLALPTWACLQMGRIRAADDTLECAAQWLEEHVDRDARVGVNRHLDLPLVREAEFLTGARQRLLNGFSRAWLRHQVLSEGQPEPGWKLCDLSMKTPFSAERVAKEPRAYLRSLDLDYVVLEVFVEGSRSTALTALRRGAQALGERVARISPDADSHASDMSFAYHDSVGHFSTDELTDPNVTLRALGALRAGPVIEIYELRSN